MTRADRAREPVLDEPVIVLTAARSGSTLLRLILDAHPDLACPPETNIVKVCAQLSGIFTMLDAGDPGTSSGEQELTEAALSGIRGMVSSVYRDYLLRRGKVRWCDKSLGTAPIAAWFSEVYPKAKFICLYRHCMDVIDSGLEASPWGLMGYGFEQFAGTRNGNSISALAAYWLEHSARIHEFEKQHGDRCIRVYYERLCEDPEGVAGDIFSFIGAGEIPGFTEHLPRQEDLGVTGPGDHKVRATRKITADSVGRGIRVPVNLIPALQLKVVNQLLGELGYAVVDDSWRKSACPPALLPPGAGAGARRPDAMPLSAGGMIDRALLDNIGDVIRDKVGTGLGLGLPRDRLAEPAFGLVAYHPSEHRLAQWWRVDLAARSVTPVDINAPGAEANGQFQVGWLVTGDVGTWLGVLSDRENMASCIRAGTLRYIDMDHDGDRDNGLAKSMTVEKRLTIVRELLGLAGYPEEAATPATDALT